MNLIPLKALIEINISKTVITKLVFPLSSKTQRICAENSQMKYLPTDFLGKLTTLYISRTKISQLKVENLKEIKFLSIDNSCILEINLTANLKLKSVYYSDY